MKTNMDPMRYATLTEVIKNLLRAEAIEVVLIQESVAASTQPNTVAPVKIYVPKESLGAPETF